MRRRSLTPHFFSDAGRNLYALLTGLVLVYYPYGAAAIQAVPPLVLTYLAMVLLPRHCGTAAWFINLPYIIWM